MMTYKKPDFRKANICANEILVASHTIDIFPIRVKRVIREWSDIQMITYEYAKNLGIDIEAFGSQSALLHELNGRHLMFYNNCEPDRRIKFSILHEFGHYYLGHDLNKARKDDYDICEVEANCFAAQILMPEQVINELRNKGVRITEEYLMEIFSVSKEAAEKRMITLGKRQNIWRDESEKLYDETILFKYQGFINAIMPKRNNAYYDDEWERQRERDSWDYDRRSRYGTYC